VLPEEIVRSYDATRDFSGKAVRSACYAPYVSMYLNTTGDVQACCKNQTFVLGNVGEDSLDAIWKGARIGQLRKALARNAFGAGCEHCEWQIRSENFPDVYTRIFEEFPVASAVPEWPSMLEFTISNTCNFECVMCYGELSSSIRSHREGLPPLPRVYDEKFFADLRRFLPHLTRVKFFGGEPFLAQESFRIWDMMFEDGITIPCHATTNGSIWNARVERVLEHFPVSISVSIDGATQETFERIRVNGRFDVVMRNLDRFHEYARRRKTALTLTHCLMRQNWREFFDVLLIGERYGCDVGMNTVIDPPDCSLFTLRADEQLAIADELEAIGRDRLHLLRINRNVWDNEIRNLRAHATRGLAEDLDGVKKRTQEARAALDGRKADHVSPAWQLVFDGKLAEALERVEKTGESNVYYWQSRVLRAHVLRLMGKLAESEAQLARCLEMTSRRPEPYAERAWLRLEQNRVDEGLADARRSLELSRVGEATETSALNVLGCLLNRCGKAQEALGLFDRLLAAQPDHPFFRVNRGWACLGLGQVDGAIAEAERVLATAPENVAALDLHRVAVARRKNAPEIHP